MVERKWGNSDWTLVFTKQCDCLLNTLGCSLVFDFGVPWWNGKDIQYPSQPPASVKNLRWGLCRRKHSEKAQDCLKLHSQILVRILFSNEILIWLFLRHPKQTEKGTGSSSLPHFLQLPSPVMVKRGGRAGGSLENSDSSMKSDN